MNRHALASLDAARPAIARLDRSRHAEELAADLIEAWGGVETALRAMIGGSPLAGQPLIREARSRQLISFEQANALAEFHAARERAQDTSYHPSDADINAAREGFLKLEASLMMPEPVDPPLTTPGESMSTKGLRTTPLGTPQPVPLPSERKPWVIPAIALVVLIALGAGAWFIMRGRGDGYLDRGVEYWQRGQREMAVSEFSRAVREHPSKAMPHVYLSRMAREVGNLTLAGQEANLAVQAEPDNAVALREMASYLLAAGNFELARKFYVRALTANPQDRTSMGFLGCSLIRLGRTDEGMRWMNRAGQGSWSGCAQPSPMAPGMMPPPGTTPVIPR
jgi:tetratricopeptide (TPR) repeat protein